MIKIKTADLYMLMQYIEKESPEFVTITKGEDKFYFSVKFEFVDKEDRECQVLIYQDTMATPPDLIKKMRLETRTKSKKT